MSMNAKPLGHFAKFVFPCLFATLACQESDRENVDSIPSNSGGTTNSSGGLGHTSSGGSISASSVSTTRGSTTVQGGTMASSAGGSTATSSGTNASTGSVPATGGASTSVGGRTGGGEPTGATPVLPTITSPCPTFATGTATIGGLSGISLQVGDKKNGSGSLLFYWHGTGSSASEVNRLVPATVRQEILNEGGIIVSFGGSLGTGGDCSGTSTFSKDDFKVADLIAACAVRDHAIDPRRIYTTGCSAGGLQAGCMGAMRSSYVAATAPNSGGEVTKQPIQDPSHVPAVMTMHGGSSDVVVVSFKTTSATYDAHMDSAGSFVVNCNHNGGHCQAPAALYSAAWEFMKSHPFGVTPEPYAAALPSSFPDYCTVY